MKILEIRDNPAYADRYTGVFDLIGDRQGNYEALGMNHAPYHPLGIGMHCSAMPGDHLGVLITFDVLPKDCQSLVLSELAQ